MAKRNITDRWLKSKIAAGDYWDAGFPGFGVRVSDTGRKTFVLAARYSPGSNPARRALGVYPKITLEKAREKAREWTALIGAGKDPAIEEERQRAAEQQKRNTTFAAMVEDFIRDKLPKERSREAVERELRKDLIPKLGKRPIAEITDLEILAIIKAKARTAPVASRNLLALAKRLFTWAIDQRVYGITTSPCAGLKPTKIIGERHSRDRILSDDELFALWRASGRLPYPHGPVYRLLMLTALRLNEAAEASWPEFDMRNGAWTIPAARMKGREGKARAHVVPITDGIKEVLAGLPRFKGKNAGEHLFTTTNGTTPAWMGDKVKKRLDARMERTLKALARHRGEDPAAVSLQSWANHDIRRTVRSELSRLRVPEAASEAIMAHVRPGIVGVYDRHLYLDEKREALEMWAARLRSIVEPAPANVVTMKARA